jgi:uncharacterized membrane protein YjjP (DUF1212 family)
MDPVDAALDVALIVLQNGGSTVAAERSFTNILKAYKQDGVSTVWRLDFIAATRSAGPTQATWLRRVGPVGVNLARAAEANMVAERAAKGEIATTTLDAEIARIRGLPSPYTRWILVVAAAGSAGAFAQLVGGDPGSLLVAAVAASAGQTVRPLLHGARLAAIPTTLVCGILSAMIAGIALRLGCCQAMSATLIASVIYMTPGLPLINGFLDMASFKHLIIGMERMLNAAFLFLVLAIAIAVALTTVLR